MTENQLKNAIKLLISANTFRHGDCSCSLLFGAFCLYVDFKHNEPSMKEIVDDFYKQIEEIENYPLNAKDLFMSINPSDHKGYDGYDGDRSCDFTWKDALQDDIENLVEDIIIKDSLLVSAKWKNTGYKPGQRLDDIELEYLQERIEEKKLVNGTEKEYKIKHVKMI